MRRKLVLLVFLLAILIEISVGILFLSSGNALYLFFITLLIITFISFIIYFKDTRSEEAIYESYMKKILKTFDSILVKIIEIPSFSERKIIKVAELEDLMDAQAEIRKPINYFEENNGTSFILLDDKEAYIYILKKKNVELVIEEHIKDCNSTSRKNNYSELFDEIDKTMIIMIDNDKAYKISPIREKSEKTRDIFNHSSSVDNDIEII